MRSLITLIVFAGIPLWGQAPSVGVDTSHDQEQQTKLGGTQPQADKRGTKDSPFVIDTKGHHTTKEEAAEEEREKYDVKLIERWTLGTALSVAAFTGLLVIIGAFGVYAANRTLRAIERQATLQAASMAQWVTPGNWRVEVLQTQGPLSGYPKMLGITFDISNESNFPLTLSGVFGFCGALPGAPTNVILPTLVNPKKPHTSFVHVYPTEKQSSEYVEGVLRIAVDGTYTHVGVTGERGPNMHIIGNLVCGKGPIPPYMENEVIRLIPPGPAPKLGLLHYLELYWESRKPKDGEEG
jgi:hypothetical protein